MFRLLCVALIAVLLLSAAGCGSDPVQDIAAQPVRVFAAASTTDVIHAVAAQFTADTGIEVICNIGSSSTLARQIENGAPADVYLSANVQWMDRLERSGLVDPDTRRNLLGNALVIIAPASRPMTIDVQQGDQLPVRVRGRLAMGDPSHVPAGRYARQALQSLGWWEQLEPRIVAASDARAAVMYVSRGDVDAGIVYATDAHAFDDVTIVAQLPADAHEPIRYPVALTTNAGPNARRFLEALHGDAATAVFERAGFIAFH